jgi:hypothetical protein
LHFRFGSSSLLFTLGLVASGSGELSLEVVLDLLLARLLLLLERGKIVFSGLVFAVLLLLRGLLLLLSRLLANTFKES